MSLHPEEWLFIGCTAVCAVGVIVAWLLRPGGWFDQRFADALTGSPS